NLAGTFVDLSSLPDEFRSSEFVLKSPTSSRGSTPSAAASFLTVLNRASSPAASSLAIVMREMPLRSATSSYRTQCRGAHAAETLVAGQASAWFAGPPQRWALNKAD